ncbi:DNA mismatch endonuclease Vsr [Bradyrhizobium sp. ORS 375]|uniref:very short patch repair endonuclease n=1 Tax=Bradyrhizobium sp. (strain ORS 375) TaxID=566679 RepID=UPI0009FBE5B6|nr:DNA mismatch endonuclease Vsr [Bradyrhizobium sp. ORS 375]
MDIVSKKKRSAMMAAVRDKNTGPELLVRRALHACGYRFRLHRRDLPGRPDVVLPKHKTVIFVHGCFWHRHTGCKKATVPKSNADFWAKKFDQNLARDARAVAALRREGWRIITAWECELPNMAAAQDWVEKNLVASSR